MGRTKVEAAIPPPLPPRGEPANTIPEKTIPEKKQVSPQIAPSTSSTSSKKPIKPPQKARINAGEWELKFGQVWLVRIGVIFLLTGLIFLSTYAYKNWLFNTGPLVKVSFFMLISLGLTGAGLWLENWKTRFKQYGRVVASGGLAAGYYTLYASHFTPSLKVVNSPVFAGLLLTLWAGVMLAYAVWKKSRIVAVMAIGLAFYGTVINPAGALSLFSSLLLSTAGMWLLLKFRWVGVGLSTMIAAYVAHAFWLGYYPIPIGESIDESLRLTYLACYWVLFTVALLVPQAHTLAQSIQRAFCAINNAAAWGLTVFLIPSFSPHHNIGWISIGIGTLWILLAVTIQLNPGTKGWHKSLAVIYGYQGVLIASLGILLEATGYTRFLIMAVEACVLLAGARYFGGWLARLASAAAFTCALLTALPGLHTHAWPSYAALALVCATYTVIVRKDKNRQWSDLALIPASATWFVLAGGVFTQWTPAYGMNGLWVLAILVIVGYLLLKRPTWLEDIALISVPVVIVGGIWYLNLSQGLNWGLSFCPVIGAGVFWYISPLINLVWEHRLNQKRNTNHFTLEWVFSGLMWCMITMMTQHNLASTSYWMLLGGVLALSGHAISNHTQRNSIGVPALSLHLLALIYLLIDGEASPWLGWMPALFLVIHLALVDCHWKLIKQRVLLPLLCVGLVLATGIHAFQIADRPDLVLTALGVFFLAWAYLRKNLIFAKAGAIPALVIACLSSLIMHGSQDWGRYVPIIAIMVCHGFLWLKTSQTHNPDDDDPWLPTRAILLTTALLSLFIAVSIHVRVSFDGSGLSICWAMIAFILFALGLIMRCRAYRLVGLTWLAAAVVHVIGVDVMRLGSLGRILSFIILGVVLLVLGFLYNRFQETIRKFL